MKMMKKKYIHSIIEKLFEKDEKKLHEITGNAIFECHKYLKESFDPSVVSLREIARFSKCVEFFQQYFVNKDNYLNKKNINDKQKLQKIYKIKSIICSIYLCYYIRLIDEAKRAEFDPRLKPILLELVNSTQFTKKEEGNEAEIILGEKYKEGSLIDNINFEELQNDLRDQKIIQFSDLLKLEEDFLINLIELDKGIYISKINILDF